MKKKKSQTKIVGEKNKRNKLVAKSYVENETIWKLQMLWFNNERGGSD